MKTFFRRSARMANAAIALALAATMFVPAVAPEVFAIGQVTSRSVEMSSSNPSNPSTSYTVGFTTATTGVIQGVVVDFCQESPIPGNTCTAPTGMALSGLAVNTVVGLNPTTGWTATNPTSDTHAIEIYNASGASVSSSVAISFQITGITNPSSTGSFYARIFTYTTKAAADGYTSTSVGAPTDDGGAALSTATQISITATVMEQLAFCTSAAAPTQNTTSDCAGTTTPTLTIGHGSPTHLDSTAVDTAIAYTQLSTNAQSGATVRMTDTTADGSCTNGGISSSATNCIPGNGAFAAITAGTAAFGLNVGNGTTGADSSGSSTANANYGTTAGSYGMGTNVTSTYGDPILSASAPCAEINNALTFGATAATTTKAGIYTANMTLIATGTF